MAGVSDIKAGRAFVELGTKDSALLSGLDKAVKRVAAFGNAIRNVGLKTAGVGAAIFSPLAAAGTQFAEHGAALEHGSQKTGVGVEALSTLGYAAQQSGGDTESLEKGLTKMSRTLVEASQGSKQAASAFAHLGLSVAELQKLSQEDRLKLIADRISKIKDPAMQAAAAMKIFGKGGADMLPLLLQGSQGISAMQAHAKALGLQWSGEDAKAALTFSHTLKDLWDVLNHGVDVIGAAVAPALGEMAQFVTAVTIAATQWISTHRQFITVALLVGVALLGIGTALVVVGTMFGLVASAVATLGTIFAIITSPITLIIAAIIGAGYALFALTDAGSVMGKALSGVFKQVWDVIKFVAQNTSSASDAMEAAMTIAATYIQEAWATAKGFIVGLWISLKSYTGSVWDEISDLITNAAFAASDGFLKAWAHTMHAWNSLVNATADKIQKTFFETGNDALQKDLAKNAQLEKDGKLTPQGRAAADATSHSTFDTYDDKQQASRDKANDDELDKKLDAIQKEKTARDNYLADLRAKRDAAATAETQAEQAKNAKQIADAKEAAKQARAAYYAELGKTHFASGEPSLWQQGASQLDDFKKRFDDIAKSAGSVPEAKTPGEDGGAADWNNVAAKSSGSFNTDALFGYAGGGSDQKKTNDHLQNLNNTANSILNAVADVALSRSGIPIT